MPAGEEAKTLANAEVLLRGLAAAGMDHDDHVAALGGGVVGDVAGFCAAVYQRGVGVVQVPTTLVAQVDSAYGGKTGVDLPEGKNYVGAYHQPRAVLADPRVLATLPPEELAAGWAEVIKTALIAGGPLWARVRRGAQDVDRDLVLACARTKLGVVARDERDAGRRQVLNLGHTVGHAIETATGYARYRHGEAVGLGLLAALTLSGQERPAGRGGRAARGARAADAGWTPTSTRPRSSPPSQRDKKRRGGRVGFVVVDAPGEVRTGVPIDERRRPRRDPGAAMRTPRRRPARHQPRRAGPAPGPALRRAHLHAARAAASRGFGRELGLAINCFQTNHEGEFVEELHKTSDYADGLILNPGAWTHYAWSLRDAVEISGLPMVEVHLSDVDAREAFRQRVGARGGARAGRSPGKGADGYREALELLKEAW